MLIHGLSEYDPKLSVRCNDCGHTLRAHGAGTELTCFECECAGWQPVESEVERILALFVRWGIEVQELELKRLEELNPLLREALDAYEDWIISTGREYEVPAVQQQVDPWIEHLVNRPRAWWHAWRARAFARE